MKNDRLFTGNRGKAGLTGMLVCVLLVMCACVFTAVAEEEKPRATAEPHGEFVESKNSWAALRGLPRLADRIHGEETKIPVVAVYTQDQYPVYSLEEYVPCRVFMMNGGEGYDMTDAEQGMAAGIRVRGNSSAYYGVVEDMQGQQLPYRIRFDEKANMFGLNNGLERRSWVLLKAEWNLVANDVGYKLGKILLHEGNFCTDSMLVHMYLNGKFAGIYLLCEQNQTGKGRVEIDEPKKDYTGTETGYLLEIDNYEEEPCFNVYYSDARVDVKDEEAEYTGAEMKDVKNEKRAFVSAAYSVHSDITDPAQMDFIAQYVNDVFYIVYSACEKKEYYTFDEAWNVVPAGAEIKNAEQAVAAVMDVDSVVDMYILEELVCNNDVGEGSFYMCVDFSEKSTCEKLRFTCPWDYGWGYEGKPDKGYFAGRFCDKSFVSKYGDRTNPWFIVLCKQDWFRARVTARFEECRNDMNKMLDAEKKMLEGYRRDLSVENDWTVNSALSLVDWVKNRIKWFDKVY